MHDLLHFFVKSPAYLEFRDEVDVALTRKLLPDPLLKHSGKAFVDLQPRCVETQAQRSTILTVMSEKNSVIWCYQCLLKSGRKSETLFHTSNLIFALTLFHFF